MASASTAARDATLPKQTWAQATPFEVRSSEARRIVGKFPDRIPVICEKAPRSDLPDLQRKKFVVNGTTLIGEFKYVIHAHLSRSSAPVAASQTIYLFAGSKALKTGTLMSEVYEAHKAEDGCLYINYSAENSLGM